MRVAVRLTAALLPAEAGSGSEREDWPMPGQNAARGKTTEAGWYCQVGVTRAGGRPPRSRQLRLAGGWSPLTAFKLAQQHCRQGFMPGIFRCQLQETVNTRGRG